MDDELEVGVCSGCGERRPLLFRQLWETVPSKPPTRPRIQYCEPCALKRIRERDPNHPLVKESAP